MPTPLSSGSRIVGLRCRRPKRIQYLMLIAAASPTGCKAASRTVSGIVLLGHNLPLSHRDSKLCAMSQGGAEPVKLWRLCKEDATISRLRAEHLSYHTPCTLQRFTRRCVATSQDITELGFAMRLRRYQQGDEDVSRTDGSRTVLHHKTAWNFQ